MASRLLPLADAKNDRNRALKRSAGRLSVEGLVFGLRNSRSAILRGISFRLDAGEVLGIIGPSGAGKSTLARQIIGVLAPSAGAVRLDGADVSTWPRKSLGRVLGYLPQDIELFADTVAARSPYAGQVVGLSVSSVGGVIGRGDKILDVVPERDLLIIEAQINVDDISDVHPQDAESTSPA